MANLEEIIRAEIHEHGPMRFDHFMELALYHPGLGYYSKPGGPSPIGKSGDFYTSVSVGPLFGHLLARQFFQMWERLGRPSPFWIVEQGAHDGQLACDILGWCRAELPEFLDAIRYGIVQATGTLRMLQKCAPQEGLIDYITWFETIDGLAAEHPVGVFFSNELPDAFPVRSVTYRCYKWHEQAIRVDDAGALAWTDLPIEDDELLQAIEAAHPPEEEGYTTEFNLRATRWMGEVARAMQRGYMVTIDYGFPAPIYYADFRKSGTLTAYVKHKSVDDVLAEPGMRDITAHVDFTALARAGEAAGMTTLGFVDQQRFLTGIAHDELAGLAGPKLGIQKDLHAWNALIRPEFLGTDFQALVQAKDAPAELDGLRFSRPSDVL